MITVFTAVLGNTDPLRSPYVVNRDVRYVCFTDREMTVSPYEMVRLDTSTPLHSARNLKILANHPALGRLDVSVWHDAAFQLLCDPQALADALGGADVAALAHPHRATIEHEADAIAGLGFVDRDVLAKQIASYRSRGFTQTVLTTTGLLVRRHSSRMAAFHAAWWGEILSWHYRDQMSIDYVLWRYGITCRHLDGDYRANPYARWRLQRTGVLAS